MSTLTPHVTEIFPATFGIADIMAAIFTHIDVVSTRFEIDLVSGSGSDHAFSFTSMADPSAQIVFRRDGATMKFSIDPGMTITDVGDATTVPTGGSADWSGEKTYTLGTLAAGSKIWLVEQIDALSVMMSSSTGVSWQYSLQIGKIYAPDFPELDVPLGRDGYGAMVGAPVTGTYYATTNWADTGGTGNPNNLLHIATGVWNASAMPIGSSLQSSSANSENPTYVGYSRPFAISIMPSTLTYAVQIGVLKYLFTCGSTRLPLSRIDLNNLTDLAFILGGVVGAATANRTLIPWLRSVVP